jgi:capsular polysaccharide transport system permease protein
MSRTIPFPSLKRAIEPATVTELPRLPRHVSVASRRARLSRHLFFMSLPMLFCLAYLTFMAADRYDVQSDFAVQPLIQAGGSNPGAAPGATNRFNLNQASGAPGAFDAYIVMDYLQSPDALRELETRIGFLQRYRGGTADVFYRPETWYLLAKQIVARQPLAIPFEDQLVYFNQMVQLRYSLTENIVTLDVQGFTAEDSDLIAKTLLAMGEVFINRMNERGLADMVKFAETQVHEDEKRLVGDHVKIQEWRAANNDLPPDQLTTLILQVVQGLEANLVAAKAELMQMKTYDTSPVRRAAETRVKAFEDQIATEQKHLDDLERSFSPQFYQYDRLKEDVSFAETAYQSDLAALQNLRALASQQGIYLQRVYEPHVPQKAIYPQWALLLSLSMLGGMLGYGILRMIIALGREKWMH